MEQELDIPKTIDDITVIADKMYATTKDCLENNRIIKFNSLLEIATSKPVILKAIHNIKSNKGSNTSGVDKRIMQVDVLEREYKGVLREFNKRFIKYNANKVLRVYIPKSNGKKRPLGIPTIYDRIIQECIRMTIEPILEAQFFAHSYGFRPMRDTKQALQRVKYIMHHTGYTWVVEGDIKGFFDNVNHNILLKKLWNMGIRDRRFLMIIKQILKAGVLNESDISEKGTPQGGIISPLLANVYLHSFDKYISREWEEKQTRYEYADIASKNFALKKTALTPCYIVRYADDWLIITNNKTNAEKLKYRASRYCKETLKIELSDEKTLITNAKKKRVKFLGIYVKAFKRNNQRRLITKTYADEMRLKEKVCDILLDIRNLHNIRDANSVIGAIFKINSKIRGILNYYNCASQISVQVSKYDKHMTYLAYKVLQKNTNVKSEWVKSNLVDNLQKVHKEHNRDLPTVIKDGKKIGITNISFVSFVPTPNKIQNETPYSVKGREIYLNRTSKRIFKMLDEGIFETNDRSLEFRNQNGLYNFEFHLNRPYAYKRDRGKCRCCGTKLEPYNICVHHIQPYLVKCKVNKLDNLACVCVKCHSLIHAKSEILLDNKIKRKIEKFRNELRNI